MTSFFILTPADDPLLGGPIAAPAGAIVNRPDDVEPKEVWECTTKPPGYA